MRNSLKKESFAVALILMAFFSGIVLTAATSGCDAPNNLAADPSGSANEPAETISN